MNSTQLLWSIDPYQTNLELWRRAKDLALCASQSYKLPLLPIFIASADSGRQDKDQKTYANRTKARMVRLLRNLEPAQLATPCVFFAAESSLKSKTQGLNRFAVAKGTPLIVTATRGASGLKRLFNGSFVESMVAYSNVPVLVANEHCEKIVPFRKIIFATDFSRLSKAAFIKVCRSAKELGAKLDIVSVLPDPMRFADPTISVDAGALEYLGRSWLRKESRLIKASGQRLVTRAKKLGVRASFRLEEAPHTTVADAILSLAPKYDLVAIAAKGDTSRSHLFGSTSQEILRHSPRPIWVFHLPDLKSKEV